MIKWLIILLYTPLNAFYNIMPIMIEKQANFLYFMLLIIYLYYWHKILQKSNFNNQNRYFFQFSAVFWVVALLCHILMLFWQLYEVHFPLFTPLVMLVYSLFWGFSFLSEHNIILFLLNISICLYYLYIVFKYFKYTSE